MFMHLDTCDGFTLDISYLHLDFEVPVHEAVVTCGQMSLLRLVILIYLKLGGERFKHLNCLLPAIW